jgi:hypothetical protein
LPQRSPKDDGRIRGCVDIGDERRSNLTTDAGRCVEPALRAERYGGCPGCVVNTIAVVLSVGVGAPDETVGGIVKCVGAQELKRESVEASTWTWGSWFSRAGNI